MSCNDPATIDSSWGFCASPRFWYLASWDASALLGEPPLVVFEHVLRLLDDQFRSYIHGVVQEWVEDGGGPVARGK